MEYEKSSTAFSRKMSNRSRSHSLSFSANAIYDGVFASKTNTRSPMVDYGEIFRGSSGPSPSSIPFLDVPELNNGGGGGGKVKIDVRSSKLDYSSVFGGFGDCDFAVNPKELIVKSKNDVKRNRRKGGSSYDDVVPLCTEAKKIDSSPDMVRMKHSDIPNKETRQGKESVTTHSSEVPIVAGPAKMVDNISPLRKVESETGVSLVEKKQCNEGVEEVKASSRKRSSKTEVDFGEVFGSNDCGTRDKSTMCNTGSDDGYRDAKPLPSSLQRTVNGGNGGSERLMGMKLGVSEKFKTEDDDDSTSSPPFFDAETDVDSSAAESSAALKKAIEEAQVRMNIAKQMMDRKKSGFRSSAKLKSCDDPKVEDKVDINVGGVTEEIKDNNPQIIGEVQGHSSEQSCLDEGDQNVKRARKLWGVPEVLLKTTTDHKREEVEEQEVVQLEEDQARRGRKHWELPGEIFKSVINSKPQEPKNLAPAKPETDTKQEVQPLSENPFYTFGQLGSKLKCVVEAFTGSKVSQKDETQVIEKENSILPQMVQGEQSDSQEKLAAIPVMERCLKEVEETLQQTESKTEIKIEENPESQMCTFAEECSQKMDEEIGGQVMSACDSEDGPKCGGEDFRENPDPTYNFLDQEGEKDIVSGPQEMFVGSDDTKTYVKEVEEIPTHDQSLSKTQVDVSVGTIVSFVTENTQPGHLHEETELKAPRRRRVWKTSEDVCNMIKAPKENNRPWQLENAETETSQMPFQMEGLRIHDTSEETGSTSEQASDSGLQENWTVLKQMFRQMFQTTDTTKVDGETYCLVDSEKEHIDIYQKAGETSYCQMTGTDRYEQNQVETVETEAYAHTRENEDVELAHDVYCREEDGKVEVQGKSSSVHELIREELEATGVASDQEREDVPEAFEEAIWAQGLSQLNEIKEHADTHPEMLEYDPSETDSNKSGERFEKMPEIARDIKTDGSIDTDTSRSSFEMRHGDSYIEEVGVEQDFSDQFHEKNSAASSTEEHIEEIDSDSIQSGWSVVDDDDKINSYVDVSLAGHLQKPEEMEQAQEETDEMKGVTEQEHPFECQKEEVDRSNVEQADSTCSLPKEDENIGASHVKDNEGDESCRSSMEEEGDATSDASQKEAERVKKHLKKKDETREKERERFMVERAIREARERAFADAKERAGKAAMEKAKAGAPRRRAPEVPRRSEKGSVDVNDKLSSAEKASMQAKQRSERAAVERVLSEARERALEKALSNKSAASQTRGYGGSKSFSSSSGEKRASSSSGTENKSSGPSSSSNLPAKGEPIQRCKARSERHQRTSDRAAEALAEKKLHDLKAQKEQAERNRLAESLDADVKRWSSGKESNLRALLSTLQYILGAESGWKPIPLTDLVASASVRKAYRKATLYVHPDKLQQRGASTQQKYICEKVFDLLKEAWNKFGAEER